MNDLTVLTDDELAARRAELWKQIHEVDAEKSRRRVAVVEAKGWTRCCRCFPRAVGKDGFCGCCLMNHATGVRMEFNDPDLAEPPVTTTTEPADA